MLRVLIIAAFAAFLATSGRADARPDDWRTTSAGGDVRVEGGAVAVTVGTTFKNDVAIQTGPNGHVTRARGSGSIVVGPNARVRLSPDNAYVETGSIRLYRPGAAGETLSAGRNASLRRDGVASETASGASAGDRTTVSSALRELQTAPAKIMPPSAGPSADMPRIRQSTATNASRSAIAESALPPRQPPNVQGAPASGLRIAPARDVDLPAVSTNAGLRSLADFEPAAPISHKTDEQKLEAIQNAWSEVARRGLPGVDDRAAEKLQRIKPKFGAHRIETERPEAIVKIAAIAMTVLVAAELAILGLVAWRRSARRAKASQVQPRWMTI